MRFLVADEISNRTNSFESGMFCPRDNVDFLDLGLREMKNTRVIPLAWGEVVDRIERGSYAGAFIGRPTRLWNPRKALWRNACRLAKNTASGFTAFRLGSLLSHLQAAKVPIGGVDTSDAPVIDNSRFSILRASRVFFKRELPTNPANSFLYTNDRTEDTGNIMRIPFFSESVAKLRPVSLGVEDSYFEKLAVYNPAKDLDVFFAGATPNRPTRLIGLRHLQRLKEEGFRVVATDVRFSHEEYLALAARALVCWSPEGYGFDCYRTYEVAALGSVPLLKVPPIISYAPFQAENNGLFYSHEGTDFYDVLKAHLTGRSELAEMGQRAREHVRACHRDSMLAAYMIETLLETGSER
jgi:hypothetical protein